VTELEIVGAFDVRLARGTAGLLRDFNDAGILSTSDVHVALRLARLSGVDDDVVSLGAAFAARAPRLGNVCVDLATIHTTADADTDTPADLGALPWPAAPAWIRQMAASGIVGDERPLHLEGTTLYLDRLWADESLVATELRERSDGAAPGVDTDLLRSGLDE
jgi:exodeoxyribonuclease V alpha subunit